MKMCDLNLVEQITLVFFIMSGTQINGRNVHEILLVNILWFKFKGV